MAKAIVHCGSHGCDEGRGAPEHPIPDWLNVCTPCPNWFVCGRVRFEDDAYVQGVNDGTALHQAVDGENSSTCGGSSLSSVGVITQHRPFSIVTPFKFSMRATQ
jgi:hypothetical protein